MKRAIGTIVASFLVSTQALMPLQPGPRPRVKGQIGITSWYGPGFHGKKTASRTRFNRYAFTCAHRTLPLGSWVRVEVLEEVLPVVPQDPFILSTHPSPIRGLWPKPAQVFGTKAYLDLKVTDRGPYVAGRILDLSEGAAMRLGIKDQGLAMVRVTRIPG